ncbi:alpha/beta-hydrolase [Punctularia strigosozonata HHB-11173 SS5]|uniref:alpha/beta-hydrolase n=1 Tax=Punctularia strigosozonata (strain HHB-11173) TaxID=741275 RepID=UPI00044185BB|nr:alpha/beta-hydrolase [Punctularia strigosozonata HHB-11173 SS5]EIN06504.1 alpha/beta-hydrolase [Punctularia strigosozonata HHB-11173 SS5]
MLRIALIFAFLAAAGTLAQRSIPNTWPQNYTGIPRGDYSPEWQHYFEVKGALPNVTKPFAPRSFAGNIKVNRPGHDNDTLFFWAIEKELGSLTAPEVERNDKPWLIWLNGGPGSSSFLGFMTENGPLHVTADYSIVENKYSWDKLADAIWVDQPVGTGFSTADTTGYIADEDQMGQDFLGFLSNLVKVFPSLAKRPFYLTGESYAGTYIPYITKAIFQSPKPPVNLVKFAIGDGAIGDLATFEELPAVQLIETYPQLVNFDIDVLNYFKEQQHLCGYDLNFTYPQNGHFPTLLDPFASVSNDDAMNGAFFSRGSFTLRSDSWRTAIAERYASRANAGKIVKRKPEEREMARQAWKQEKRDLSQRANGTIDPWYGCFLLDELTDYAVNFSFPWTLGGFDVYDIPDALNPEAPSDPSVFLNNHITRSALHAPTSKNWTSSFNYPFNSSRAQIPGANEFGDPSVPPMAFLSELAANASAHHVSMVFYSGNDDALVAHRGTEVIIQNMTFGGIQGFTRVPSTPWFDDDGNLAGIVHQERNLAYVLFIGAGHLVPQWKPDAAFVFLREFILGSNKTGLVVDPHKPAIGGEDPSIAPADVIPGTTAIFYGSGTTVSSALVASASIASWESVVVHATITAGAHATSLGF